MKAFFLLMGTTLILSLAISRAHTQQPQDVRKEDGFRLQLQGPAVSLIWNDAGKELATVGSYHRPEDPHAKIDLVNIYNVASGEHRFLDIMKEFPTARFANVDGLAIGPQGSVLIACDADLPNAAYTRDFERLLLYDNKGALIRDLRTSPYDVAAVAMDSDGNIYMLGTHDDEQSSEESYPLIVKYDTFGHITQEMLSRSLFSEVDDPTEAIGRQPHTPSALLAVDHAAVRAYLPGTGEMVVLDSEGNIQTRVNVDGKLLELARGDGYYDFQAEAYFSPDGDLWFQGIRLNSKDSAPRRPSNFLVRFTPTGQLETPYKIDPDPHRRMARLIGFTQSNEPVAYSQGDTAGSVLIQTNPY
jgi:hypothetical protein